MFCSVWLTVLALYELRLSKLLIAGDSQVFSFVSIILIPFIVTALLFALYAALAPKEKYAARSLLHCERDAADLVILRGRLKKWFLVWILMTVVEIIVSRGLPLWWLLTGTPKTYFDFGIPSIHGLLNSLLLAIGLCYTGLFAKFGNRKYLLCLAWVVLWSVLAVTRALIVIFLLETFLIISFYRGITGRFVLKLVTIFLVVVIGFGAVGDLRTGASTFRDLAQPTEAYPEWLPSGDLWVYIYLTTPLNNLIYTANSQHPVNDPRFPNTAAPLFPSIIRSIIYPENLSESLSGELVESAFNVSTAYVGPYQDYGTIGMACLSILIGLVASIYWRRSTFRNALIYSVLGQCLILTVFDNNLFYLPVISQIFWIYLFFHKNPSARSVLQPSMRLNNNPTAG